MLGALVDLHVHRWGLGNARRALLVHGVAADGGGWWQIAEALAGDGFEVFAPDLRGHGSSPTATRYGFDDFASDLCSLGVHWDVIIGHSLGGPIVCALLSSGAETERTVLLDPVFEIADADLDSIASEQVDEADPFADPRQLAAAHPRWHPLDCHHKALAARAVSPWTVERVMYDNAPWHHGAMASVLQMPTVVLGADPMVFTMCPPELGESIVSTLPNARFEVVRGAGHGIHRDAPDAVTRAATGTA